MTGSVPYGGIVALTGAAAVTPTVAANSPTRLIRVVRALPDVLRSRTLMGTSSMLGGSR
jgi:hypothetical protein